MRWGRRSIRMPELSLQLPFASALMCCQPNAPLHNHRKPCRSLNFNCLTLQDEVSYLLGEILMIPLFPKTMLRHVKNRYW